MSEFVCDLRMIDVDQINIDPEYQRLLDDDRARKLASAYTLGAAGAVSLSRRQDGTLWCYDGQTRLAAAIRSGVRQVPAVIVPGSKEKEAAWFLMINEGRKRVHVRDRHKAGVVAKDESAIKANRLIEKFDLVISNGGNRAGQTNAIGAIRRYVMQNPARLDSAMQFLFDAWPDENETWSAIMIRAAWEAAGRGDQFVASLKRAARRCKVTPRRILDAASGVQLATGQPGGGSAYVFRAMCQLCQVEYE